MTATFEEVILVQPSVHGRGQIESSRLIPLAHATLLPLMRDIAELNSIRAARPPSTNAVHLCAAVLSHTRFSWPLLSPSGPNTYFILKKIVFTSPNHGSMCRLQPSQRIARWPGCS